MSEWGLEQQVENPPAKGSWLPLYWVAWLVCVSLMPEPDLNAASKRKLSPLDEVLASEESREGASTANRSSGSLFAPGVAFGDLARDFRASGVGDLVTILVADRATAVSRGSVSSQRQASAQGSLTVLPNLLPASMQVGDIAGLSGGTQLKGQAETSRDNVLTTTVSARVVRVLGDGNLVVEGVKSVKVNAEQQQVRVRGLVRPVDLSQANVVLSDRVAYLEVEVAGKGIVGDAVRRPNVLYRVLLGLLPF